MVWTWDELAARALARQFPTTAPASVAAALVAAGPIPSQTARSTHLGLAARRPGTTAAEVAAAFEDHSLVRGSTVRGTVHTATPDQFAALSPAVRAGQRPVWRRQLGLDDDETDALWASTEAYAGPRWRTVDDLVAHHTAWLEARSRTQAVAHMTSGAGRYLTFGHGGLVRRPVDGRWEGQGAAEYRTLAALGPGSGQRAGGLGPVVRMHLAAHGPASRHDLAWWSGVGLRAVDGALAALGEEVALESATGPDGRLYVDLPGGPAPTALTGVRLLPEFDSLLCAYEPSARLRFVTADHHAALWNRANGLGLPPLLVDGRVTGHWRAAGSARRRPLSVHPFAGTRVPTEGELDAPVAALEAALGITVTSVTTEPVR